MQELQIELYILDLDLLINFINLILNDIWGYCQSSDPCPVKSLAVG